MVDITHGLLSASWNRITPDQAKKLVEHNCAKCPSSGPIVMGNGHGGPQCWCYACYNKFCKNNPDDVRAHETQELSMTAFRKDANTRAGRANISRKKTETMAIVRLCVEKWRQVRQAAPGGDARHSGEWP